MKLEFIIEIPEKYVNLNVMNNYRQKTEKIGKDKFKIEVSDTPREIIEIVRNRRTNFKIPRKVESLKHVIESLEDLLYILRDYTDAMVSKYRKGRSPFWEYYEEGLDNGCGVRNRIFKRLLEEAGFETRLIGGIYLDQESFEKRKVCATHVWVEVKIDNLWIEVDAAGELFPTFSCVRMNYLKEWEKFDFDFWIKGIVRPRIY